jgi:hypothetical protein
VGIAIVSRANWAKGAEGIVLAYMSVVIVSRADWSPV